MAQNRHSYIVHSPSVAKCPDPHERFGLAGGRGGGGGGRGDGGAPAQRLLLRAPAGAPPLLPPPSGLHSSQDAKLKMPSDIVADRATTRALPACWTTRCRAASASSTTSPSAPSTPSHRCAPQTSLGAVHVAGGNQGVWKRNQERILALEKIRASRIC